MNENTMNDDFLLNLMSVVLEKETCSFGANEREGVKLLVNKVEMLTVNLHKAEEQIHQLEAEIQYLRSQQIA